MITETVWLGHDNTIDLILKADDVALTNDQMDAITKITISLDGQTLESTNQAGDLIRWRQAGYATGEIRIDLGAQSLTIARHDVYLGVYDPTYTDGVIWAEGRRPSFRVIVKAEVEAS